MTTHTPARSGHPELVAATGGTMMSTAAARSLAVLRIATGFIFLWAFLDKLFGLNYSTADARAWVNGGNPTKGFLSSVAVGPFESTFHSIAGDTWVNILFMLGLAGVGAAVMLGVGLRLSAVAGTLLMAGMWFAEFPLAQHTSAGEASGSTNPFVDYHLIYALALIVFALTYAGRTWGFGKLWARLPFVARNRWLL